MVDEVVVEVDGLLHEAKAERVDAEVEVGLRVVHRSGDVMQTEYGRFHASEVASSLHERQDVNLVPMTATILPDRTEAAEYYFTYIDQVSRDADIRKILETQLDETLALLAPISDAKSLHRYAPDKWSIREVVSHLNDSERVFTYRALWFARGFDSPLPSFDQDIAVAGRRC